jgi:hypothetical protein
MGVLKKGLARLRSEKETKVEQVPDMPQTHVVSRVVVELLFQDIDPHREAPAAVVWMAVRVEMLEPVVSR